MAKYMLKVCYSHEGIHGVRKEGAASRAAYIGQTPPERLDVHASVLPSGDGTGSPSKPSE